MDVSSNRVPGGVDVVFIDEAEYIPGEEVRVIVAGVPGVNIPQFFIISILSWLTNEQIGGPSIISQNCKPQQLPHAIAINTIPHRTITLIKIFVFNIRS